MNTLVIVLIAAVCLLAGYILYGRWLANKWGVDPKAKTPACAMEDGQDYVPTDGWTVFAHQFSSIAGAGPVTGAIQAAVFGWLPVLLWVILGGIFFGAVTDFGALYASVKNEGKSMGLLIETYIGKTGRKLFLLFCWLFTLIVIAAFADMVAGTFNAYTVKDGVTALSPAAQTNGAAGSISLLFIVFAMVFGLIQKKLHLTGWKETAVGLDGSGFCHRYGISADSRKGNMVLSDICLYLYGRCAPHVVFDAAQRLHDDLYVCGHDHWCSGGAGSGSSFDESSGIYRIQE